jgi:curved DNA-binding protein CbpA
MGNEKSRPVEQSYSDYITQQQRLIQAQQEQIKQLSKMNLRQNILNQQQTPSNIMFQQTAEQQQMNYQQMNSKQMNYQQMNSKQMNYQQQPKLNYEPEKEKQKLNPYKILGIPKNFDENTLKKAYLKMAMKTHPDRGGTQEQFQQVSIAYTVLLKRLKDQNNNHQHIDLRDQSRKYSETQTQDSLQNVNLSDKFDSDVFNKIYAENRINDVYDSGYGNWMDKNPASEDEPKRMFNGNFNKNMFNSEFDKYKKEQQKNIGSQVIKYDEPQVDISFKGKDSLMVLGKGNIDDFSGESNGGLNYRDYKDAFTNSCLIDTSSTDTRGRPRNINDMESSRSNISYQMSHEDQQQYQIKKQREEQEEQQRQQRLQNFEEKAFNSYDQIHKRMLGR